MDEGILENLSQVARMILRYLGYRNVILNNRTISRIVGAAKSFAIFTLDLVITSLTCCGNQQERFFCQARQKLWNSSLDLKSLIQGEHLMKKKKI